MNKKNVKKMDWLLTARALIAAASIGHLVFTSIHVKALLLLENEICGFIMFLFVLLGLVTLFEMTRIQTEKISEKIFTMLLCVGTIAAGLYLTTIYSSAIANQRSLDIPVVNRAVVFSRILMVMYAAAGILMAVDLKKKS